MLAFARRRLLLIRSPARWSWESPGRPDQPARSAAELRTQVPPIAEAWLSRRSARRARWGSRLTEAGTATCGLRLVEGASGTLPWRHSPASRWR